MYDLFDRKVIQEFQGEYRFLSNFWPCSIVQDGYQFNSVEVAYQYSKCFKQSDKDKLIECFDPFLAKKLGREISVVQDWDKKKFQIMEALVRIKFLDNPELRTMLKSTGDAILVEGNTWGDKYQGVCKGEGLNMLGQILMSVRNIL